MASPNFDYVQGNVFYNASPEPGHHVGEDFVALASGAEDATPAESTEWMLRVVVDLGERPSVLAVADYLRALQQLFDHGLNIEYRRRPGRYVADERRRLLAVAHMRLSSPLELILTNTVNAAPIAGYVAAGWVLVERTLKMVMDWQNHRQTLAERQMAVIQRGLEPAGETLVRTAPLRVVERVAEPSDRQLPSGEAGSAE
ncbi:hypothetical protein [Actinoplanes sp. NPDC048796]|uniref:hypothetical protein n=1 Tax=unclassified Actinoplanes TaxID=2626549 RepID=UPI0033E5B238